MLAFLFAFEYMENLNEAIEYKLKMLKINRSQFAKMIGLSAQYVGQLLDNKGRRWNADIEDKALEVLKIKKVYNVK
jgi:hypothetical protein